MLDVFLDAVGQIQDWVNEDVVPLIMTNSIFRRQNKKDKMEYNDAVWQASQNKADNEKREKEIEAKSRAITQKTMQKSMAKSKEQNKNIEKRLIARMASKWASARRAENKKFDKPKKR